jgi:hypothetical protein
MTGAISEDPQDGVGHVEGISLLASSRRMGSG